MSAEFYTVIEDERGTLRLEFYRRMAFVHLTFNLPLEGMRAAKHMWPELKALLSRMGYAAVHVIIPDDDERLYRFERHFGFEEIKRDGGAILMAQEC